MIGSKVTANLPNGWILPIGGVASGRVFACSLRSRLVYTYFLCKFFTDVDSKRKMAKYDTPASEGFIASYLPSEKNVNEIRKFAKFFFRIFT